MIEKIKTYVEDACSRPENYLTESFYKEHLLVVYEYCTRLCSILSCDEETACVSSLLHDISAVFDFKSLPTHNLDSARIAGEVLQSYNYPQHKIEKVKKCIENHMSPIALNKGTLDDIVLSNADAISQIVNPSYWLYFAFRIRNLNYENGMKWYSERITNNWNLLIEPAKQLIENDYLKVRSVFN
jgi:uncharacterized protein